METGDMKNALPPKTLFCNRFKVSKVIGQGGFGITYLASDLTTGGQVVIKENLPDVFAARNPRTLRVEPNPGDEEEYDKASQRFYEEALILSRLRHKSIVQVLRAFRGLNTSYYVMPYVGGQDFLKLIRKKLRFTESTLVPMLGSLLSGLAYLHDLNILHRDIKPANILCLKDGTPVLIDFGTARETGRGKVVTVLASPGYAPVEQLQQNGNLGPWSDIYSLGATMYHAVTGKMPPPCMDRVAGHDPYQPLASDPDLLKYNSREFLAGIDKALSLWPEGRWQSAREWMSYLDFHTRAPEPESPAPPPSAWVDEMPPLSPAVNPSKGWWIVGLVIFCMLLLVLYLLFPEYVEIVLSWFA